MARMLSEEDFALFTRWRVGAFGRKLREICEDEAFDDMTFEDKIGARIDAELEARDSRKIDKAVRAARFKIKGACVEDIYYLPDRNLTRDRIARLASCAWVEARENLVIISESGRGRQELHRAGAGRRGMPEPHVCALRETQRYVPRDQRGERRGTGLRRARPVLETGPAHPRRLLHDADREPAQRGRPLRDIGVARRPRLDDVRLAARARPVVPEDQLRAVRRLDTEPRRGARQGPRHQGAEHAGVHRRPQGGDGKGILGLTSVSV
ncbi:ATP-binding protein [Collinsella tanakaei]|nr:ATP-binding protein [Collinsella tanakaei]